jgi:hypothetical protein
MARKPKAPTAATRLAISPRVSKQAESDLVRASVETLADIFAARGTPVLDALQMVANGLVQEMAIRGINIDQTCTCPACTQRRERSTPF